jgi:hypothetical protein
MKTKTYFAFRIDIWDDVGNCIIDHVAGVDDFEVAEATYRAATACARPRVRYDGRGPFPPFAHWGGDPFLLLEVTSKPARPSRSGFSFARGEHRRPRPRCNGGDARR